MKPTIKIAWLFPNTFCLHGDRGNLLALKFECQRRGYETEVTKINLDTENFNPLDYDVMFCPPGEIENFGPVIEYLLPYKKELIKFIEKRPFLVTGTSLGLFGKIIRRDDGSMIEGLNIINIQIKENDKVYGDDLYFSCHYNGKEMEIIGNQIQMMQVDIQDEASFGILRYGYGNTGKTRFEGIREGKAIFTNTLGPILVGNPWLTVEMINVVEENIGMEPFSKKRDNQLEIASLKTKVELIDKKETHLIPLEDRKG